MFKVTDRRLETARPILDKYSQKLEELGRFPVARFEYELREAWQVGYKSIKSAVIDLHKNHKRTYRRVAEHYMRNQAPRGMMVSEFKHALGECDRDIPIIITTLLGTIPVSAMEEHRINQLEAQEKWTGIEAMVLVLGPDEFLRRLEPRKSFVSAN